MIEIVSGDLSKNRDWAEVWSSSKQYSQVVEELERLKEVNKHVPLSNVDDKYEFASSTSTQLRLVLARASLQIYRQTDYVINKIALHIGVGLLNGFSWWMIVSPVFLSRSLLVKLEFWTTELLPRWTTESSVHLVRLPVCRARGHCPDAAQVHRQPRPLRDTRKES